MSNLSKNFSVESKVGEWHFALVYVWAVTFKSTQEKWGLLARLCSLHLGKHYRQTKPKLLRKALTLSCAAATENSPWKAAYAIVYVWGPWEHLPTASKSCPARWTMGAYWSMCGKNNRRIYCNKRGNACGTQSWIEISTKKVQKNCLNMWSAWRNQSRIQ